MNTAWNSPRGVYVVAEIGLNHNGDTEQAKQLIGVAADAGVDAVKFQKRDVDSLAIKSVLDNPDPRFPSFGATYREIRERHEFSAEEFLLLRNEAVSKGLTFFVTPFDIPSLQFLDLLEVDRYKVASHSVTNLPLLESIAKNGKPVLLSSGMCTLEELDRAVKIFQERGIDLALLHCVSSYPTLPEDTRLDLIQFYKNRYSIPVGYSGHEEGFSPTLYSVAAGAQLVERHITLDNSLEGFDHRLSVDPGDLHALVSEIRKIQSMFPGGPKLVTDKERLTRDKYQVSMVSLGRINKGDRLTPSSFTFKNPGTGIPPGEASQLLGRRARFDIDGDTILSKDQFE